MPILIDKSLFKGMPNLQFLIVHDGRWWLKSESRLYLPEGLAYLPRKLRLLKWNKFPLKCLPSDYKGQYLVELTMEDSKLEKLWEGTPVIILIYFAKFHPVILSCQYYNIHCVICFNILLFQRCKKKKKYSLINLFKNVYERVYLLSFSLFVFSHSEASRR